MSFTDRVETYVASLGGDSACDNCIDAALAAPPRSANIAARRLACIGAATRRRGCCDSCGSTKLVTSIAPVSPSAVAALRSDQQPR